MSGLLPTLTVSVQWSHDGVLWADDDQTTDTFTVFNGVGARVRRVTVKGPWMRVSWTIGGTTPSVTFSVTAY